MLEEILEKNGDCMLWSRCRDCPFVDYCGTLTINKLNVSKKERVNMALDRLSNYYLLNDYEEIKETKYEETKDGMQKSFNEALRSNQRK